MGYLEFGLRLDLGSTILALEVKVYWGQLSSTIFQTLGPYLFLQYLRSIASTAMILTPCVSLVKKNRVIPNFAQKS